MTNMSSACGCCTLKASNIKTLEALYRAFKIQENWKYATYTSSEFNPEKIDNKYTLDLTFNGWGRWNYTENITSFCRWSKGELAEEDIKILVDNDWSMYYIFNDEECGCDLECGCDFLYRAELELIHVQKEGYENTISFERNFENYDRTAVNFILLEIPYDLDDFIKYEISDVYDLSLADELKKAFERLGNLEELAKYHNCSVDELGKKYKELGKLLKIKFI